MVARPRQNFKPNFARESKTISGKTIWLAQIGSNPLLADESAFIYLQPKTKSALATAWPLHKKLLRVHATFKTSAQPRLERAHAI